MLAHLFKPPRAKRRVIASRRSPLAQALMATITLTIGLAAEPVFAQSQTMQPGEAFLTRFSGLQDLGAGPVLNSAGIVGSIFDMSSPGAKAMGQKIDSIFSRKDITAAEVGQIFGVALDPVTSDIYLSASSAYGLFREADNSGWMEGMWGPDAGPGTIWKLPAATNYVPEIFAEVTLDGRSNSGASLGNLAIDTKNKQLFVSDMETGYIHRFSLQDGSQLGRYDHGQTGRTSFVDKTDEAAAGLDPVSFNPATSALVDGCPFGAFSETPSCWNFADFRRRVFGLAVRKDARDGSLRLFYSVWGSQGFGHPAWAAAPQSEKRNSVWSIGLAADGSLDVTDIRRELMLPEFFTEFADIASKGPSHGAPDIAFPTCKQPDTMLVNERAGIRPTGLGGLMPPTFDNEARLLRFGLDVTAKWQLEGHHDIGFPKRVSEPLDRANSTGGVAFGYGYTAEGFLDTSKPDQFIWSTGTRLCTEGAPCFDTASSDFADLSFVDGMQGFSFNAPTGQFPDNPSEAAVPANSYMVDADGDVSQSNLGQIGDVEILQKCEGSQAEVTPDPVPDWPIPDWWPEDPPIIPEGDPYPDLKVTKTHSGAPCRAGAPCAFIVNVANVGAADFTGPLFVEDVLPAGTLFDSVAAPWTCSVTGPGSVDCFHPPVVLTPGDSIDLFMMIHVPPAMANHRQIRNCAAIKWMMNEPPTPIMYERALALRGYHVGPIDGILDAVTQAAITQYQIDHGLPITGIIDLALHNSLFGGDSGWGDINPANDQDCVTVPLDPYVPPVNRVDLEIHKQHVGNPCYPGSLCSFFIRISNVGTQPYGSTITFTDILPAGWTVDNVATNLMTPWNCGPMGGNSLSCTHDPSILPPPFLPVGNSVALTLTARVPANENRHIVENCASIDFNPAAPQSPGALGNDQSCAPVNLMVLKSVEEDPKPEVEDKPDTSVTPLPLPLPQPQPRVRCPKGWIGKYQPNCRKPRCEDKGMTGQWPNCKPKLRACPPGTIGKYQPNCRPITCKDKGLAGKYPNCYRPSCERKGMIGKWPNCKPKPRACPPGTIGKYQPNCRPITCKDKGLAGKYPNCYRPSCERKGLIGKWPNCKPKPQKIRCPRGWIGKYQPNCRPPAVKVPPKVFKPQVIPNKVITPKPLKVSPGVIRCPKGLVPYKGRCITQLR